TSRPDIAGATPPPSPESARYSCHSFAARPATIFPRIQDRPPRHLHLFRALAASVFGRRYAEYQNASHLQVEASDQSSAQSCSHSATRIELAATVYSFGKVP